jgi:hypothetical protein
MKYDLNGISPTLAAIASTLVVSFGESNSGYAEQITTLARKLKQYPVAPDAFPLFAATLALHAALIASCAQRKHCQRVEERSEKHVRNAGLQVEMTLAAAKKH